MKKLAFLVCLFAGVSAHAQHEGMVWTEVGVSGKVVKRLGWSADLNARFGAAGLETFFPQIGFKYKVEKWFRPSIDYRYILDKDKYGNMLGGHRINFNANFEETIDRFEVEARVRYQYAFNGFVASDNFDPDLDRSWRLKGDVKYDINNSIF